MRTRLYLLALAGLLAAPVFFAGHVSTSGASLGPRRVLRTVQHKPVAQTEGHRDVRSVALAWLLMQHKQFVLPTH